MKTTYGKPVVAPDDIVERLDALIPRSIAGEPLLWVARAVATPVLIEARAEIERLRAHVDALEETLGLLVDHQNGCPLPSYADAWNLAMAMAKDLLEAKP